MLNWRASILWSLLARSRAKLFATWTYAWSNSKHNDLPHQRKPAKRNRRENKRAACSQISVTYLWKCHYNIFAVFYGTFQVVLVVKNLPANAGDMKHGFSPWVGKIPWRRVCQATPVFLPRESHGQKSLAGYSTWLRQESNLTEVP